MARRADGVPESCNILGIARMKVRAPAAHKILRTIPANGCTKYVVDELWPEATSRNWHYILSSASLSSSI